MDPRLQYHDVVGIEGPDYTFEVYTYENISQQWCYNPLVAIDPQLEYLSAQEQYPGRELNPHNLRRQFTAYDPDAHGFSQTTLRNQSHPFDIQLGIPMSYENIDPYRQLRYRSPTDPTSITLSSNESSYGDYSFSPDVVRPSHNAVLTAPLREMQQFDLDRMEFCSWNPVENGMASAALDPNLSPQAPLSMRDLQMTPDTEVEDIQLDEPETLQPNLSPEELELNENVTSPGDSGIGQSMDEDESIKEEDPPTDNSIQDSDNDSEFTPVRNKRKSTRKTREGLHRREQHASPLREVLGPVRVVKQNQNRRNSVNHSRSKTKRPSLKKQQSEPKSLPCTFHHYGCPSTFANKNEWKRHVSSQHLKLGFWRCDLGTCSPKDVRTRQRGFNDFNRKDLFTQHCRRMHAPWTGTKRGEDGVPKREREKFERELEDIRTRCWIDLRKAPSRSKCGFCDKTFIDTPDKSAWEDRMEHVGRHYERDGAVREEEDVDLGLQDWAVKEGLLVVGHGGDYRLVGYESVPMPASSYGSGLNKKPFLKDESEDDDLTEEEDDDDDRAERAKDEGVIKPEDGDEHDAEAETDDDAEGEVE